MEIDSNLYIPVWTTSFDRQCLFSNCGSAQQPCGCDPLQRARVLRFEGRKKGMNETDEDFLDPAFVPMLPSCKQSHQSYTFHPFCFCDDLEWGIAQVVSGVYYWYLVENSNRSRLAKLKAKCVSPLFSESL